MRRSTRRRAVAAVLPLLACLLAMPDGPLAADRSGRAGAHAIATTVLGALPPEPLYWHLDTYPTRTDAVAAATVRGTVAESMGRIWLFTIAPAGWRAAGGTHVASIGPLRLGTAGGFTATYLEARTRPGFRTDVHQHAGPEAVYTLAGALCVETPQGAVVGRAGDEPILLAGDQPMQLTSIGSEVRRSIVLVVHDAARPWKVPARGWSPTGLCERR
jgi:quercetin dioxygenase-like cupin family protein